MGGAERLLLGLPFYARYCCRFKGLLKAQAGDQYCSGTGSV